VLASEVLDAARMKLVAFEQSFPPGYKMEIGGEKEERRKGFLNMAIVIAISVTMILLTLEVQFNYAIKPSIVFAAIPYGVVGALEAL